MRWTTRGARSAGMGLERVAVIVLGLYLTGTGGAALGRGHWSYTDYLGLEVPAPLAVVAGLLLLLLGVVRWSRVPWER